MAVPLEQFVKQLEDSGILVGETLKGFIPPKADPKDAEELARELVRKKKLTKFQAEEVYRGKGKSLTLGNYVLMEKIGAGGMGQVFKAEHRRMHRIVAIKVLPPNLTKDAAAIARFEREVTAAAKISHPNIVAAHDADCANGVHFLVMELVEGSDLSALVKSDGPLPVEKAVNYILQAAKGLEAAHAVGIVHRDIKPANLLLDKKGMVKILDMGLARLSGDGDAPTAAELTSSGTVMGTVDYMAPEQALSTKTADARADIYSLGCSLHYLLTAKATYDGDTLMAKLLAHREQPLPSLRAARPEVPEQIEVVFKKMLAKKAEDRYQTMTEVIADLEGLGSGQTVNLPSFTASDTGLTNFLKEVEMSQARGAVSKQVTSATVGNKKNNKKLLLIGAAVLGVAILAGLVVKLMTKDGTLIVTVNEPDAEVQVLTEDGTVEITKKGKKGSISISVDPGKHRLKVTKDGFSVFGQDFEIEAGGKKPITAKLVPLEEKPAVVGKKPAPVVGGAEKPLFFQTPGWEPWATEVAAMPAEKQVEEVSKKLVELNPGFDGKVTPMILDGVVKEFQFHTDHVLDISPVRAMNGMDVLKCTGSAAGREPLANGRLTDLTPLQGLKLRGLDCECTGVRDLTPLKGMPLTFGYFGDTQVADLTPLRGMDLTALLCQRTRVKDLSPLQGMRITLLMCDGTKVADLSPVRGMPLSDCYCNDSLVSDLSPLHGMSLKVLWLTPQRITKGMPGIREMNSLQTIGFGWGKDQFAPDEFWKKYDAGEFGKPITDFNSPAFQQWVKDVQAMSAEEQIKAVSKKLVELNPGFDGTVTPTIDNGVVTGLQFVTDNVTDISPVRALSGLMTLKCPGNQFNGILADVSPLQGMQLTTLILGGNPKLSELSPLRGMPLTALDFYGCTTVTAIEPLNGMPLTFLSLGGTQAKDLTPLKGMPLKFLNLLQCPVRDLSPLIGTPLEDLYFYSPNSKVTDLSPLAQLPLKSLVIDIKPGRDIEFLRSIETLVMINEHPAAEFWKEVEERQKEKKLGFQMPGFDQWVKDVQAMPAEQQVEAVSKKLVELNPGFDGKLTETSWAGTRLLQIENGVVVGISFSTDKVTDISPVRALSGLKLLNVSGEKLADLSPLEGMKLTLLVCIGTQVSDLSPLQGMPLTELVCYGSRISNLSPLKQAKLTYLHCDSTEVSDLSPLQGMQLTGLLIRITKVSDTSPLKGMPLVQLALDFKPERDTEILRSIKTLKTINDKPAAEFWKEVEEQQKGKKLGFQMPGFDQWMKDVQAMPAEQQVEAVSKKLIELNPGFDGTLTDWDGKGTPRIENGVVVALGIVTDNVTDISPIRALVGLTRLGCCGGDHVSGKLTDLSPVHGLPLTVLSILNTQVSDLSPLRDMPLALLHCGNTHVSSLSPLEGTLSLTNLNCDGTKVSDLSPLRGVKLTVLHCSMTSVSDLSPIRGMPLTVLRCAHTKVSNLSPLEGMHLGHLDIYNTPVSDLSPLQGMNLTEARITPKNITDGLDVIRKMESLKTLGIDSNNQWPPDEFWKKFDDGEFGKPTPQ